MLADDFNTFVQNISSDAQAAGFHKSLISLHNKKKRVKRWEDGIKANKLALTERWAANSGVWGSYEEKSVGVYEKRELE